ncbi:MAG TPA: helix-turn-helix domain-containing protein [Gemmatimonadaceae bacterium]|nr:helix-turn-helix domain-containing protein [Gemmatimonadaceae bacterium]
MSRADRHDAVFKALADARRRRMLDLVRDTPRTTGELCDRFPDLDRCTVMQHLQVLERADLIIPQRIGRVRWNHINPLPLKEVADRWINRHAVHAIDGLAALKDRLERAG